MSDRSNNFDTLRFVAASTVLLSHAVPLSYGSEKSEIISRLSRGQSSAGELSVVVFFVISGYLITASFQHSRHVLDFVAARLLRLLPALAVVLILLAFVVGPMLTSIQLLDYFRSSNVYRFVAMNLALRHAYGLPGVFSTNPYPGVVNGSLWTLQYEAECYMVILVLGAFGCLTRKWVTVVYLASLVGSTFWITGTRFVFMSVFMGGSMIRVWRPPLQRWVAVACAGLWISILLTTGERLAEATVGAYLVLYFALTPDIRLPNLARWGDVSYGIYIYAFPVQQIVTLLLAASVTWYWNVAIAYPVVLFLAFASWHFIEAPCLALKARFRRPTVGVPLLAMAEARPIKGIESPPKY